MKLTPIAPKQEVIVKTISDLVFTVPKAENQTPTLPTKKKQKRSYVKVRMLVHFWGPVHNYSLNS